MDHRWIWFLLEPWVQVLLWLVCFQVRRVIVRCHSFDGRDECWEGILSVFKANLGYPLLVPLLNMSPIDVLFSASPSLEALQALHAWLNLLLLRLERLSVQDTDLLLYYLLWWSFSYQMIHVRLRLVLSHNDFWWSLRSLSLILSSNLNSSLSYLFFGFDQDLLSKRLLTFSLLRHLNFDQLWHGLLLYKLSTVKCLPLNSLTCL